MKTCPNCGERVYRLGCVNCDEAAYIEAQAAEDADWRVCNCGRRYYRSETVTDECENCYELRLGL